MNASYGGGIYMYGAGNPIIKRNVIKGNTVGSKGGGICIMSGDGALIVQNLITGNQAAEGGGIYWQAFGSHGPIFVSNTVADNDATLGGSGVFADGFDRQTTLVNNIIVANPGQVGFHCGSSPYQNPPIEQNPPIIRFNNTYSAGGTAYGGTCSDMTGTDGNISADPLFTNPTQGDYHLQFWSPSIDAGDNQTPNLPDMDMDGDPRILDGDGNGTATIDMGVDEFLLPPGLTWPISTIRSPGEGATVSTGITISITGLARDAGGGTVSRVEVSVDGGVTWIAATGTTAWSYDWTPATPGPATIKSRAVAGSGNVQNPPAEITVTVRTPVIIRAPSEYLTIQEAIDAAGYGDTVLVAPGIYHENIDFRGKAITVRSESGRDVTTIDGGNADSVVIFTSGEQRNSVLNGFTLQNGRASFDRSSEGGGIVIRNSSPTIINNKITNNHACQGGGVGIRFGSPLIQGNTITSNGANLCSIGLGSGISIRGASFAEILDNEISENTGSYEGGGIYMSVAITPIVKRNIIRGNNAGQGGGIYLEKYSYALIVQNLITGNQATFGAGIYWLNAGLRGPILVNNTIADNDATSIGFSIGVIGVDARMTLINNIIVAKPGQIGFHCDTSSNQNLPIFRFNNIYSAGGMAYGGDCPDMTGTNGNISADPLFTNPTLGDYHLQLGSLSIDTGDNQAPNLPDTDIDGDPRILDGNGDGTAIIDMGVDEFLAPSLRSVFKMRATVIYPRSIRQTASICLLGARKSP